MEDPLKEAKKIEADIFGNIGNLKNMMQNLGKRAEEIIRAPKLIERIQIKENNQGLIAKEMFSDNSIKLIFKNEQNQKKYFDENFK